MAPFFLLVAVFATAGCSYTQDPFVGQWWWTGSVAAVNFVTIAKAPSGYLVTSSIGHPPLHTLFRRSGPELDANVPVVVHGKATGGTQHVSIRFERRSGRILLTRANGPTLQYERPEARAGVPPGTRLLIILMYVFVPLAILACLIVGLWRRGRCPPWVLVVAALAAGFLLIIAILDTRDGSGFWWVVAWMALAVASLATAVVGRRRRWSISPSSALLGLGLLAPAMVVLVYLAIFASALSWVQASW
jgi:hypothetical protein